MQHHRLAVATLSALVLVACGHTASQAPAALNVDVTTARRQDIATYLTLDGQISPLEQSSLAFQQSGTITSIGVNVGDRVHEGQLLARIDDSLLRAQLAQAEAAYRESAATARGAVVGLPVTQTQNTTALATARAAYQNAQLVYRQDSTLYHEGYVSLQALEAARSTYVQELSAYQAATMAIRNNVVASENVKASLASAESAYAQAHLLEAEIAQTYLYAPYDGVITARLMDPGSYAAPTAPVLGISRVNTVWVNVNVPDADLLYVTPGKLLSFWSDSLPGRVFRGRVSAVNAVPTSGTLSYLARLDLPNPGGLLRGGMLVNVVVMQERRQNVIVVPRSAIAQTGNGSFIYTVHNNIATQVPVRLGLQTGTLAEVISPRVSPGTTVITTRPDSLRDGSAVAVTDAPAR